MSYTNPINASQELILANEVEDKDVLVKVNDGGTVRDGIIVHGDSGAVSMPRQSYVRTRLSSNQTILPSTSTVLIFTTVLEDRQSEYNSSTGEFTALEDGIYQVNVRLHWVILSTGRYVQIISSIGGGALVQSYNTFTPATQETQTSASFCVELEKSDVFKIRVQHNDSVSRDVRAFYAASGLEITKIA